MFFRILHLACGLMIVLLGVKIYAIAGDLMGDADSPSSSLTTVAMAQPQPQPQPQPQAAPPAAPTEAPPAAPKPAGAAPTLAMALPKTDDLCAHGGCKDPCQLRQHQRLSQQIPHSWNSSLAGKRSWIGVMQH